MSSKMDGLRAMREAKYAANAKRGAAGAGSGTPSAARKSPPVAPEAPQATARPAAPAPVPTPEDAPAEGTEALCGHRNMGGRTCTREAGHAAKSHRYS
jgi:hypothetical protein